MGEKVPNFKAGEDGQNIYDKDRVGMTWDINRLNEIDAMPLADRPMDEKEKVLDDAQERYAKAQTEATLTNEQYYTKPNEDPDAERFRQEQIAKLQNDLREQM